MKDYASMSDQQINQLVAFALGCKEVVPDIFMDDIRRYEFDKPKNKSASRFYFDPCNNPADAWPIITENRISIIHLDDNEWGCRGDGDKSACRAINSNALRCAMIVFLMMKENEND